MTHPLIINDELVLHGFVGGDGFFFDGFTSRQVIEALAEMGGDLTVRLNSGGGIASEGIAIYHALLAHDGEVTIKVDAVAASAASVILMAGDRRDVPPAAMVMIHNASGFSFGPADVHLKTAEILQKLDGQTAAIYARHTDVTEDEAKAMMDAETWLTGDEAVEQGFADSAPENDNEDDQATACIFDYRLYANAPDHLKALAAQREAAQSAISQHQGKEPAMAGPKKAAPETAAPVKTDDVIKKADLTADAVKEANPATAKALAADGAKAERERMLGIEDLAMPGHEALVAEMKADGTSVADAAIRICEAEKQTRTQQAQGVADVETLTGKVDATPAAETPAAPAKKAASTPEEMKAEYEASAALQEEFETVEDYLGVMKARAKGNVKFLSEHRKSA